MTVPELLFVLMAAGCASSQGSLIVAVPVADLRAKPHTSAQAGMHDPDQETQLLYGERLRLLEKTDGWARVEATEQAEYTHAKRWQGYPGWIPLSAAATGTPSVDPNIVVTAKWAQLWLDAYRTTPAGFQLPLGSLLRATDMGGQMWQVELVDGRIAWMAYADAASLQALNTLTPLQRRKQLLKTAELFMGDPYLWGGRSPSPAGGSSAALGVDCSGLVSLSYRTVGLSLPRDAHEQYLRAEKIKSPQPGDLIFLSEKDNPQRIVHVMIYAGDGRLIEAPGTGKTVRRITVTERLGQDLDWIAPGAVIDGQTVSFGSYLP